MTQPIQIKKPNVFYFLVDNLGMGELSSYNGGPVRLELNFCGRYRWASF
jgi:hypothetical protein